MYMEAGKADRGWHLALSHTHAPTPPFSSPLDVTAQLLINVAFMDAANIHSFRFRVPDRTDLDHAPKTVHLFINGGHLDFNDVEGVSCSSSRLC